MKNSITAVFAVVFICVFLPGCYAQHDSAVLQQTVFHYNCDSKDAFTASFDEVNDKFTITGFGVTRVLSHLISGSGARYGDEEMIYWSKGLSATVEYKGKKYSCVTNSF